MLSVIPPIINLCSGLMILGANLGSKIKSMKIVLIGTTAGSVLNFRADLIKELAEKGHDVFAFAVDYSDSSKCEVFALGAIPLDYTLNRAGLNPLRDVLDTYKLSRKLKDISPDIVLSYFSKPVIFGTIAAVFAGVPRRVGMLEGLGYVFTDQREGVSFKVALLRRIQVLLYRLSFQFLERIIFLNPDDPLDLVKKYKIKVSRVSVLGGIGLNLTDYVYSSPSNVIISFVFVGRLLAEKGVNEFISSARIVKEHYPKAEFVLLGGIDEKNPGGLTKQDVRDLVNEGVVVYPGHVDNVAEWVARSSVFVLPSYYREGVPRSTQEAMAIGRAVITTDVPGCRETVVDGLNGFMVPPWDAETLAKKMIYFIEHPECIELMGLESNKIAQDKFDAKKANKKLISYLLSAD